MKKILFTMALPALAAAAADTWYVDAGNYGKAGLDGRSVETAFGVIQDAMTNSLMSAGDTVILMPGVYDKGWAVNDYASQAMSNRVVISKNNLTIRSSTGKPADVHIVGQLSTAAGNDHGIGEGAMRCLAVNNISGAVVVGVTFRDGATCINDGRGGGVYGRSGTKLTLIDCVVSNCAAVRCGGAGYIVAHSTLFTGNYAVGGTGSAFGYGKAANCLIVYNSTDSSQPLGYIETIANCTIARNGNSSAGLNNGISGTPNIYNTLVFGQRGGNGGLVDTKMARQ